MNFRILITFSIVVLMAATNAQPGCPRCPQGTCEPSCVGEPNVGNRCTTAPPRTLWYYDSTRGICRPLRHLGCGGNNNRWCSHLGCTLICRLQIG